MTTTIERPGARSRPGGPVPGIGNDLTRKGFLFGAGSLLALAPYGCGGDAGDGGGDAANKRTIGHRYGGTEIEGSPERIVTVGLTDQDAVLALGVAPVGVTEWYGGHPHATWPWARDELGNAEPAVVGDATELNFEKIAASKPDVVLGLYAALTEDQYGTLSEIAPTVAQPEGYIDYGVPWQEQTRIVGRVLGREGEAEGLVKKVEGRLDTVRPDHPEFEGATAAIATPYQGVYVYGPDVANVRLLQQLGFEVPQGVEDLVGEADGAGLSLERLDLIDVDALVWLDAEEDEGPLAENLYKRLPVHEEGREIFLKSGGELGGASFVSVLSLPFLLDRLVPILSAAVDGNPRTGVTPS